jgi:hypothetical protein
MNTFLHQKPLFTLFLTSTIFAKSRSESLYYIWKITWGMIFYFSNLVDCKSYGYKVTVSTYNLINITCYVLTYFIYPITYWQVCAQY